jgi:hypothetical protein
MKKAVADKKLKEADVEEGNEFSGALAQAKASGASEFEVDGKKYKVTNEGFKELDAYMDRKKKEQGTGKFDKKQISTGTVYTRRYEEEPEDDDEETSDKPKKKGRKTVGAGKGKKLGAKSHGTSKLARKDSIKEGNTKDDLSVATSILGNLMRRSNKGETINPKELVDQLQLLQMRVNRLAGGFAVDTLRPETKPVVETDSIALINKGEYDREGDMAKKDLESIAMAAKELHAILGDDQNLPEWVQSKITKALDYINSSNQYMHQEMGDMPVAEVAPPGAKAERMVKHIKKSLSKDGNLSDKDKAIAYATTWKAKNAGKVEEESTETKDQHAEKAGKKVAKDIEYDEGHKGKDDNRAEKAGKKVTKDIEYDEKVKEEAPKKAKGGIEFGKGIYESINSQVEKMIVEGMSINVSMNVDENGKPTKTINVNAEGNEAETLAQLLNLAGMASKESSCGCGQTPCGCEQVEEAYGDTTPTENKPDYPTDEETTGEDDELLRRWAGGLNKPKSTGQTTIPVVASQQDRLHTMEEAKTDKLGMNLYAELQSFKAK